ncbi:MAG TPA: glycosyltransferase, partial [Chitinophagaceae bacterium]|nr:glycosyltransferase [Chitinophagaceae bacterium]
LKDLPVKLVIVGGGALESQVKECIQRYGLQERVVLTGIASNPYQYIARADCMVLSSYVEGFPNVLLEGLACGKPVVSTDCKSGPREILAPQTDPQYQVKDGIECAEFGILTDPQDAAQLAAGMRKMYEDEALRTRYARLATDRARSFDVAETVSAYGAVFKAKPHAAG